MEISYSQFFPASLLQALRRYYDFPLDATCIFFKSGLNDIYKITTQDNTYFLRVSLYNVYNTAQIEEEIRFILHLLKCGLSVVVPVPCKDASYVIELDAPEGMRQAVLFRGIEHSPAGDAHAQMKNVGKLIAQVHTASFSFQKHTSRPAIDGKMLVEESVSRVIPFLRHRPDDRAFLEKTAMPLWESVDSLLAKHEGAVGFCHGDLQPGNYYFQGEHPVLFDFDCMGWGCFSYDLGVLLANLTFRDNDIYQKTVWNAFLEGYQSIRVLNEDEKKAVYIFAALHMLRVLSYHARIREQNQGAFYYMTDYHLDIFFGAYKRLTVLADDKASLSITS